MNKEEAELIGAHVGDGTLYLSGKTPVWELRGSIEEKKYYDYISKLLKKIFNINLSPKFRGKNSYGIQTTNKSITQFFIKNKFFRRKLGAGKRRKIKKRWAREELNFLLPQVKRTSYR